jgi:hypothetical protein
MESKSLFTGMGNGLHCSELFNKPALTNISNSFLLVIVILKDMNVQKLLRKVILLL